MRSRRWVAAGLCALFALSLSSAAGAAAVPGGAVTGSVRSFDGVAIHVNFFTAPGLAKGKRAPTVMVGPGRSSAGDTNPNDSTSVSGGSPGVGTLRRAGFNVLTWDPRGFGVSGGQAEVGNPRLNIT